jgi:hypothetical protein
MNDLRVAVDVSTLSILPHSAGDKAAVYRLLDQAETDAGYDADDDENDVCTSESSSLNDDDMYIIIPPCVLTSFTNIRGKRGKRKSISSPNISLSSVNRHFDDKRSMQLIAAVVSTYCQRHENRLQLQKNFLSARFASDDMSHDSTLSYLTDATDSSATCNDASSWTTASSKRTTSGIISTNHEESTH